MTQNAQLPRVSTIEEHRKSFWRVLKAFYDVELAFEGAFGQPASDDFPCSSVLRCVIQAVGASQQSSLKYKINRLHDQSLEFCALSDDVHI